MINSGITAEWKYMWPIFKELSQNWLGVRMATNNSAQKLVEMPSVVLNAKHSWSIETKTDRIGSAEMRYLKVKGCIRIDRLKD
jgi:hypothetical protein